MAYGGKIVQSFYDYDTSTIGPYKLPIQLHYSLEGSSNSFSTYKFYELLNKYEDALAVFNNNNYCFAVVYVDKLVMLPMYQSDLKGKKELPILMFEKNLDVPTYKHVGWVKTYQDCKAVYTWPWRLLQDTQTGDVWDFKDKLEGEPLENPPLSLYKCLLDTDHRGVYFDTKKGEPVFID